MWDTWDYYMFILLFVSSSCISPKKDGCSLAVSEEFAWPCDSDNLHIKGISDPGTNRDNRATELCQDP